MKRQSANGSEAMQLWENLPESKLELIGGRLVAGNSLAGSRYLLWALLQTLGPRAALSFAPLDQWWQALAAVFRAPSLLSSPRAWESWAMQVEFTPHVAPAGPHFNWKHYDAYGLLMMGLYQAMREDEGIGTSIQRFGLRLGDDLFTPDMQCFRRDHLHHLQTYYFDGPADLVIEVTLPKHERQDALVKRQLYAAGGVPEYWIIDPALQQIDFLQLTANGYAAQPLDPDGRYRSASMPGLVCDPEQFWTSLNSSEGRRRLDEGIFTVEPSSVSISPRTASNSDEDWSWEWRPFAPRIDMRPTPIGFEQFIDWCPEAKFELLDGKPHIGGWDGTRKVLGMLLMTFGLEETLALLHPHEWVAALTAEEAERQHDAARRDAWWSTARKAAALLRERFGVERIAVIGDLIRPEPLGFWSEITLVAWNLPRDSYNLYTTLNELPDGSRIDVRRAEDASPRQQRGFETEAVAV